MTGMWWYGKKGNEMFSVETSSRQHAVQEVIVKKNSCTGSSSVGLLWHVKCFSHSRNTSELINPDSESSGKVPVRES